jgi:hypothetical protein
LRRMVAFYRLWGRESEARPLARRLAALEVAQFGGDTGGCAAPDAEPSLASELEGTLGGAATVRRMPRIWLGLVTPGILVMLALMRYSSNRVRIRSRYDAYRLAPPMTVESWPAAIALGTLLLCAATYLHCHYYAGIKHPFGVAYVKFGAICVGIASLFVYAWGIYGS